MVNRSIAVTALLTALAMTAAARPAAASCGCEKPPPVRAVVRPAFASPARSLFDPCDLTHGACVTLFGDDLVPGRTYQVDFTQNGGHHRRVDATARQARDLADGVVRPQLWVPVPPKSQLGPTAITVRDGEAVVLNVPASDFTVIASPIVVPEAGGVVAVDKYRAAVGSDGTVYVALDVSGMLPHVDFAAKGYALALRFNKDDMVIYNTQGVVMEALSSSVQDEDLNNDGDWDDPGEGDFNHNGLLDNPDISEVVPEVDTDTDMFLYSRHAFETYDLQHQPGQPRALDPTDSNWHVDGTRHTDNFHFVVAIGGASLNGDELLPGATDQFTLVFDAIVDGPAN